MSMEKMAKYRKKPIVVEAEQFLKGKPLPRGVQIESGEYASVITIHNQKTYLQYGDWVIAEPDSEHFYPCKPDIFKQTYELVERAIMIETSKGFMERVNGFLFLYIGDIEFNNRAEVRFLKDACGYIGKQQKMIGKICVAHLEDETDSCPYCDAVEEHKKVELQQNCIRKIGKAFHHWKRRRFQSSTSMVESRISKLEQAIAKGEEMLK